MIKILVTGSNGQLGCEFRKLASHVENMTFTFTSSSDLDITQPDQLEAALNGQDFHYLINCAAYTAVDKAENEHTKAFAINSEALSHIGQKCRYHNTRVIHISTDYVYDGKTWKPYTEDTSSLPESYYGQTKLLGEKKLVEHQPDTIILRTSWLYSSFGKNFVKTMLKLGSEREELRVVFDQLGSPTYAEDLANAVITMLQKINTGRVKFTPGIYNYSNEGVASWYDFAVNILRQANSSCRVLPISSKEYPTAAPRPYYSVMDKTKIKKQFLITIPHWQESLEKCLALLLHKEIES